MSDVKAYRKLTSRVLVDVADTEYCLSLVNGRDRWR